MSSSGVACGDRCMRVFVNAVYQNDVAAVLTVQAVADTLAASAGRRTWPAGSTGSPPRDPRRTRFSPVTERDISRTPSGPRR